MSVQDEECVRPGDATDATFLTKMSNNIGSHPHFTSHESTDNATRKTIGRTVCILLLAISMFLDWPLFVQAGFNIFSESTCAMKVLKANLL